MNLGGNEVRSGLKRIQFVPGRIILITESRKILHVEFGTRKLNFGLRNSESWALEPVI